MLQARCDAARRRHELERRLRFTQADADAQIARAKAFAADARLSQFHLRRQRLAAPPPDPRHVPPALRRSKTQGERMLEAALRAPQAPRPRAKREHAPDAAPRKLPRSEHDRHDHPPIL